MHAFLITGGNQISRIEKAREILSENGVGEIYSLKTNTTHSINSIRELTRYLSISPLHSGSTRGILIENAENLTEEAANAFLKSLEEPQTEVIFVLTAKSEDLILDTVSSRTLQIDLGQVADVISTQDVRDFEEKSLGQKLIFLETLSDRGLAIDFCQSLIQDVHKRLITTDGSDLQQIRTLASLLQNTEQAKYDLEHNVNIKLALGNLFLKCSNNSAI